MWVGNGRSQNRKALLEEYIEQLQDGIAPQVLAVPGYSFHPKIANVSFNLLQGGHYKRAALGANIRVVKVRSGLQLDGDALMNQAFGCDGGGSNARITAQVQICPSRPIKSKTYGIHFQHQVLDCEDFCGGPLCNSEVSMLSRPSY